MAPKKRKPDTNKLKQVSSYKSKLRPRKPAANLVEISRKKIMPSKKNRSAVQQRSSKAPCPQQYSIPGNILFYASRNPLFPAGHLKLIKSCKSLFRMSRIVPVNYLRKNSWTYYNCHGKIHKDNKNIWDAKEYGDEIINLKNKFFKLWIYDELCIDDVANSNLASTLVKRIHLSTLKDLALGHQHLTFDELQILVSGGKLEEIWYHKTVIKNSDGTITEFGKVFDALCCRKMFISLPAQQHGITKITSKKIVEVLESEKATLDICVHFRNIPEAFDFQGITGFIKANMDQGKHKIDLEFSENVSDIYKNGLQKYVNEIIKIRGVYAHTLPIITFPGEDPTALEELEKMRYDRFNGILKKPGIDCFRQRQSARMSTGGRRRRVVGPFH